MHASTARLTGAMQGLQGSGSRPCLFVRRIIPIGPQPFCGPLSTVKPHSHGAASCARLRRPGCDAPVRSRGWCARRAAGRVRSRRLAVTCAADKGARAPTAVLGLRRGARSGELRRGSSAYRCVSVLSNWHGFRVVVSPHYSGVQCGVSVCLFLRTIVEYSAEFCV